MDSDLLFDLNHLTNLPIIVFTNSANSTIIADFKEALPIRIASFFLDIFPASADLASPFFISSSFFLRASLSFFLYSSFFSSVKSLKISSGFCPFELGLFNHSSIDLSPFERL